MAIPRAGFSELPNPRIIGAACQPGGDHEFSAPQIERRRHRAVPACVRRGLGRGRTRSSVAPRTGRQ